MIRIDTDNAVIRIYKRVADELGYTKHQLYNLTFDMRTMAIGLSRITATTWSVEVIL